MFSLPVVIDFLIMLSTMDRLLLEILDISFLHLFVRADGGMATFQAIRLSD